MTDHAFPHRLRTARESRRLSVTDVARSIGCSHGSVINWEAGFCLPQRPSFNKLVKLFPELEGAVMVPKTGNRVGVRDLTDKQREVLDFIERKAMDAHLPPTLREIAATLGIGSTNAVADHLRALERKGYIARAPKKSRGIVVIKSGGTLRDAIRSLRKRICEQQEMLRKLEEELKNG